jgi:hypothetical protein
MPAALYTREFNGLPLLHKSHAGHELLAGRDRAEVSPESCAELACLLAAADFASSPEILKQQDDVWFAAAQL